MPRHFSNQEINGKIFLITNKVYNHANIACHGSGVPVGNAFTYEDKIYPDQFWRFEEDENHKGFFRIWNFEYENCRLTIAPSFGIYNNYQYQVGVLDKQYYDEQLWRLKHEGNGYYRIYNFKYDKQKLGKTGKSDQYLDPSDAEDCEDQLWKLTPKFTAEVVLTPIYKLDNRQGGKDVVRDLTTYYGVKTTQTKEVRKKIGMESSMTLGIEALGLGASNNLSTEFSTMWSTSIETNVFRKEQEKFIIPAGKDYRLSQHITTIKDLDPNAGDIIIRHINLKTEESADKLPDLPQH